MLVVSSLLEDEVTRLCGPRHERQPHRTHTRYGHQRGTATLADQKIPVALPRVRRTDGSGEVPLENYARPQSPEAMAGAVLRRTVRGVSTRHAGALTSRGGSSASAPGPEPVEARSRGRRLRRRADMP